jgi:hypothetical protein
MVLLGVVLLRAAQGLGVLALAAGIVGLVGLVLFTNAPGLPVGITERIAVYPADVVVIVFGVSVLGRHGRPRESLPLSAERVVGRDARAAVLHFRT